MSDTPDTARTHVAWLLWCLNQGYVNAADRDILTNWLSDDPATLHPADAARRPHLLAMADEVMAAAESHIRAAEREAIARLAEQHNAVADPCYDETPFADLIRARDVQ